jgi:hypothetical protein
VKISLAYLGFLMVVGGLFFLFVREKAQAVRAEIASAETLTAAVGRYDSAARDASNLATKLAECRASQRPEARCRAEGGAPVSWADGWTQCWTNAKPMALLWSSK